MKTLKIAIADDHPIVCSGVSSYIKGNTPHEIAFTAQSKTELLQLLKQYPIDVLILDVVMPDVSATELFAEILVNYRALKIIAYTSLNSPILIRMLFREGAQGYVNKSDEPAALLSAIETIAKDELYIPEEYRHLVDKKQTGNVDAVISKREKEVLLLIAEQLTTAEIAEKLFISTNTVESHRKKLFEKLQVSNMTGLIKEAIKQGYIH